MKTNVNQPIVIDIFCGIGGFSKGFEKAGFNIALGIDNWDVALETFKNNHLNSKILNADVREIKDEYYEQFKNKVDIVIGGPPCQGFSMSGKRDVNDKRNTLFEQMIRAVSIINPKIIVMENVVGLISMKTPEGKLVKEIIEEKYNELGYELECRILDASEHGVPQARKRVIFIGSRIGKVGFPKIQEEKVTVGDALGNIPDVDIESYIEPKTKFQILMSDNQKRIFNHDAMNHNEMVKKRITFVPPGGNWRDVPPEFYNVGGVHSNNYRRLDPYKPSITLKHATKSMIIHPVFDRVVTAREVARLQSFPDSFEISGTRFQQHQQLANAVPPILGNEIAKRILSKIKGSKK
jgi:DNA (cytosine-5)-methyltransferase 1